MERKRFRILSTLLAIMLAVVLVMTLSYAGEKAKGPLEDFMQSAGQTVQKVEQEIIINKRENKRSNKLQWFAKFKNDTAWLHNPSKILLGSFDNMNKESFESSLNLEDTLKTTFPLIHIYTSWGSKPDEQFPELQVKAILEMGSLPVITWEPWLTDFNSADIPTLRSIDKRDVGGMNDVAKGLYDSYIRTWAKAAAKINQPVFLRLGHEMNDPYRYPWGPQNNPAKDYVAAWQHVHKIFKEEGATKIVWVWSPHPAYGFFNEYYPGSKYVDYIGTGVLNYGTVANWSKWWSFSEIFDKHYNEFSVFKKPIMISEFGSLEVGGERSQWFKEALHQLPERYPLVKSILFFHFSDDRTTTQQAVNWYFINDTKTVKAVITETKLWGENL
jgi:hypothetical protein